MCLVAVQLVFMMLGISMATSRPALLRRACSWPSFLFSFVLMMAGIWGLTHSECQLSYWLCFTAGTLILGLQLARYDTAAIKRGLMQAGGVLLIAAIVSPWANYYAGSTNVLMLLTMSLLVSLVVLFIWPCPPLEAAVSAGGAALFAVWTVHDIAARPCSSPWLKSVEVFLDIFNLLVFTIR